VSRRITHIGVVVHDLEAAVRLWTESYGFRKVERIDIDAEGVRTAMLSLGGSPGEMSVELIEPKDKADMSNAIARKLAREGEGFYHLAMTVDDIEASGNSLEARGATVIERPPASLVEHLKRFVDPEADRRVVHPKFSNGVLIELLQARKRPPSKS
jgi:methylmalonyl-CoA/ethylmalonyl-CoA epimerase